MTGKVFIDDVGLLKLDRAVTIHSPEECLLLVRMVIRIECWNMSFCVSLLADSIIGSRVVYPRFN